VVDFSFFGIVFNFSFSDKKDFISFSSFSLEESDETGSLFLFLNKFLVTSTVLPLLGLLLIEVLIFAPFLKSSSKPLTESGNFKFLSSGISGSIMSKI